MSQHKITKIFLSSVLNYSSHYASFAISLKIKYLGMVIYGQKKNFKIPASWWQGDKGFQSRSSDVWPTWSRAQFQTSSTLGAGESFCPMVLVFGSRHKGMTQAASGVGMHKWGQAQPQQKQPHSPSTAERCLKSLCIQVPHSLGRNGPRLCKPSQTNHQYLWHFLESW